MRLFIAFWPDQHTRERMQAIQQAYTGGGRPVRPENFHLTVAFLGQVEKQRVPALQTMMQAIRIPRTELQLDRLAWFRRSQVFWLGCRWTPPPVLAAVQDLTQRLAQAGFSTDQRSWQAHVSLYRKMRNTPEIIDPEPVIWPLKPWVLVASETRPEGVEYRIIHRPPVD